MAETNNNNHYSDIAVLLKKMKNKDSFQYEDLLKWVELYYLNEIKLLGTKVIYSQKAKDTLVGDKKKINKEEYEIKEQIFHTLNENFNSYILNNEERALHVALNTYFIEDFLNNNFDKDSFLVFQDNVSEIFKTLEIATNILDKYLKYTNINFTTTGENNGILLDYDELLKLSAIILNIFYYITEFLDDKRTEQQEYLIRKALKVIFSEPKKTLSSKTDTIDLVSMVFYSNILLFDTMYYKEVMFNLPKLLDFSKPANRNTIKDIYSIFYIKKEQEIVNLDKESTVYLDIIDIDEIFNQIFSNNNIDIDKEKLMEEYLFTKENIQDNINSGSGKKLNAINHFNQQEELSLEEMENLEKERKNTLISNYKRIREIHSSLKETILGQDEVIDDIVRTKLPKLLLDVNKRPLSLLFAGDSGLGKTELAKQLAKNLNSKPLLIHMGNLKHSNMDTVLLGSPAGYVESDKKTMLEKYLIERLKKSEIPVIVFDEIEKGHSSLQNMYLEMLDEGTITFSNGNVYNLKHAIIIMTSNLGISELKRKKIGLMGTGITERKHETDKEIIIDHIKEFFKPEILNRLSEIYVFRKLSKKDITKIVNNTLNNILNHIRKSEIVQELFNNEIKKLNITEIKAILKKEKIDLHNIENIRKIEAEAENVIIQHLNEAK